MITKLNLNFYKKKFLKIKFEKLEQILSNKDSTFKLIKCIDIPRR